jgi:hypothetical protein
MSTTAEQLNGALATSTHGIRLCFDADTASLTEWSSTEDEASAGDLAVALLPHPAACDLRYVWQQLSSPAAALVLPPESRSKAVLDAGRLGVQPFRDGDAPVWDLVIRLTAVGKSVGLLGATSVPNGDLLPADDGLPAIAPTWPPRNRGWLAEHLRSFHPASADDGNSPTDPVALHAGLWLIHDFLDESHQLSQSIEGCGADRNGDYWHGIMHRREPDWSNSKYWFRRVGDHPIFFDLAVIAGQLLADSSLSDADRWSRQLGVSRSWDPFAFVDLCQAAARDASSELASIARRIQWAEILLLLAYCH